MNKLPACLLLTGLVLVSTANAQISPDVTRFDDTRSASFHATVDLTAAGAAADSIVWFGFEAWTATVLRTTQNVIVTPVTLGRLLVDSGSIIGGARNVANPRAGQKVFLWEPDTLTATKSAWDYCCGGLLGVQLQTVGAATYVPVYGAGRP